MTATSSFPTGVVAEIADVLPTDSTATCKQATLSLPWPSNHPSDVELTVGPDQSRSLRIASRLT